MKKLLYILSVLIFILAGCQNEVEVQNETEGKKTLSFSMSIPEFQVVSRAAIDDESITRIDLLVFDEKGLFIEHVKATNIDNTAKTFTAVLSSNTRILHFIANYPALDNFDESANREKSENELIPDLEVTENELVFWGRKEITSNNDTSISVEFIRNQAKVTVESNASNFEVLGYALCNYAVNGTVCPFTNEEFKYDENTPTLPETVSLVSATGAEDTDAKYMCEYLNPEGRETYVILKASLNNEGAKYYKVLLTDAEEEPYKIVRNVNYRIIITRMDAKVGSNTFKEAQETGAINHLYAEVMKDSPIISDDSGNSLTVSPLTHLFTDAGTMKSAINTKGNLGDVTYKVLSDESGILSNINISENEITADVKKVSARSSAQIRVKYGKLARTITVVAGPEYRLEAETSTTAYDKADEDVTLTFRLDKNYPDATNYPELYPIKCHIKTDNLYPVDEAGKKMLIDFDYVKGEYWYTYLAHSTGTHTLQFKTKVGSVNDVVKVESEYFTSIPADINLSGKTNWDFIVPKGALVLSSNNYTNKKEIRIYSDDYKTQIGTCKFEWSNNSWRLSEDLEINCSVNIRTLYFAFDYIYGWSNQTEKASMDISDLQQAENANYKRKTLYFK